MAKTRPSLSSTIKSKQTDRKKRLHQVDQLEQLVSGQDQQKKQRVMFYLSPGAIEALEDIVYTKRKKAEVKTSVNKSRVIESLILTEKEKSDSNI